ncbi:acyl-homoserine-lactone synthase [Rhizobium sp. CF142]|uniref:acyl-homoserine-lactone synthase n=1 Tax=Rhizobium sp. CF142 TaxID=1144314 RepID=UPI00026EFDA1|nr:acyl-homoserine-lactone synthase [Rhizobium sp. CF142]EJJ26177.1 N-acyl-L-homoserine lactone synthetase [Rhizobium sp. CF142]
MLQIIHEHDDPALMDRVWSFRHTRFVEQLGWEAVRRADRRERDQFDGPSAIHLILEHKKRIVAYSRLLPTSLPYLAAEFCPHLMATLPAERYPFEWTRCATVRNAPTINGIGASELLMTGVLECLLALGAGGVVFLTYPRVVAMMRRRGYQFGLIETVGEENGVPIQLAAASVSHDLLRLHRDKCRIFQSLLCWRGSSAGDRKSSPAAA